jgi:hypothetical protein
MVRVLIWGTGNIAKEVLDNGIQGEIIGFIESKKQRDFCGKIPVYEAGNIPEEFDFIVVASTYVNQIFNKCIQYNISMEKVIFLFQLVQQAGVSDQECISRILGEKNYINYCVRRGTFENTFFVSDLHTYNSLNKTKNFCVENRELWPILTDKYAKAGNMDNYFWQDLWAARLIFHSGIKKHFDIGSRIDGFIAHLLAMEVDVTLIDIREFPGVVEGLHTIIDDAATLGQVPNDSIESMSALCSLEHFGLGRYGDTIDPEACFKCFGEIPAKMRKGGNLYVSVPVGKERLQFNAHRIFYASTIIENFSSLHLEEYSCACDGILERNVEIHKYDNDLHDGEYRYGLFHFVKK